MAVVAAVTTGVIVAGVVTGPTVVKCIERGDFGQCISEAYFGAAPLVAEVEAEAEPAVEETVAVTAEEVAPEVVSEEPVAVAPTVTPAFELVRVEPDGSAVIAGTATPDSEVQIFANDDLIGSEPTQSTGDFAHVTSSPLPSGGVELRLLDVASGEFATTSVVVVVADDRTSEPLVVASEPGQASEILQGLDTSRSAPAPLADVSPVVAEEVAPETTEPQVTETAEAELAPAESVEQVVQAAETPAIETETPEATEPQTTVSAAEIAPVEEPAAADSTVVEEPAEPDADIEVAQVSEPAVPAAPAAEDVVTEAPAVDPPAETSAEETVVEEAEAPVRAEPEVAVEAQSEQEPEPEATSPVIAIVPPTIDAVEIDGDRNFFAGSGSEGHTVRLYVENRAVGTSVVQDGRWLVEAINVLTSAAQRIRVDMLNADGTVAARAEVDFVVDLPPAPQADPEAIDPAAPTQGEQPVAVAQTPEIAVEPESAAEQQVETASEPQVEPEPVSVPEASEAPVPTMVGTTTGDRTTSGQVIIRRGDNLWTIARRVYGEGMRYTQIFEANASQIRDPDLIYPGQVFALPGTDVVIGDEQER